jgi:hypothetical protein
VRSVIVAFGARYRRATFGDRDYIIITISKPGAEAYVYVVSAATRSSKGIVKICRRIHHISGQLASATDDDIGAGRISAEAGILLQEADQERALERVLNDQ